MCLQLKESEGHSLEPKIAEKNIGVYKVISKSGVGPYYKDLVWKRGFHYYNENPVFGIDRWEDSSGRKIIDIGEGLHSCKTRGEANNLKTEDSDYATYKIVKMIIPKGATYYEDTKRYVSSDLIYPATPKKKSLKKVIKKKKKK